MIRRKDFYRFAEILLPKIRRFLLQGNINIVINERLHASDLYIKQLSDEILMAIEGHATKDTIIFSQGEAELRFRDFQKSPLNLDEEINRLFIENRLDGHVAIFADNYNDSPVDPLILTMKSRRANMVLTGIKNKIEDAARKQLDPGKIGIIACLLETIVESDLNELASESGLQKMASYILEKNENKHLAALIFCGESELKATRNGEEFNAKALVFRNPHLPVDTVKDFPFLA